MADRDPAELAAEKLNKEIADVQAKQKAQFEIPRKNMPTENDMGPLPAKKEPTKKYAKGGKVAQLAKANGIAVRGKSKGRII